LPTPTKSRRLRLLTGNLYGPGGVEPAALVELLERENPDVLAFQELGESQYRAIERLGLYPHGAANPGPDSLGMGLLLRFPASIRRLALPRRDAWIALMPVAPHPDGAPSAVPTHQALEIINVHVTAPHHRPPWRMISHRRTQIGALLSHLNSAGRRPRVLLGDLNSTTAFPAYRALRAHLRDAAFLAASRNGGRTYPTWAPRPGWPPLLRIDHVLVDPSVEVESLRVVPLPGSDHSAVLVDVSVAFS